MAEMRREAKGDSPHPVRRVGLKISSEWPTEKEMESVLNCVYCHHTASYPIMQCEEGHLICEVEGRNFNDCPAANPNSEGGLCGASLLRVRLRWFKWMTERAAYKCPIQDCPETLMGQNDKKNHIVLKHAPKSDSDEMKDLEEFFQSTSNNRKVAGIGVSPPESETDEEVCRIFEKSPTPPSSPLNEDWMEKHVPIKLTPYPKRSAPLTAATIADTPWKSPTKLFSTVQSLELAQAIAQDDPDFGDFAEGPSFKYQFDSDVDEVRSVVSVMSFTSEPEQEFEESEQKSVQEKLLGPVVEEYVGGSRNSSPQKSVQKPEEEEEEEEILYGIGPAHKLGELFRLSKADESIYFMHKASVDGNPEKWVERFRAGRDKIPLEAIYRELEVIKDRSQFGKAYPRLGYVSPVLKWFDI